MRRQLSIGCGLIGLAVLLLAVAAAETGKTPTTSAKASPGGDRITLQITPGTRDGFYPILRASYDQYAISAAPGEQLMIEKHRFLPKADRPPDRFIIVSAAPGVTLRLAAAPAWIEPDSGYAHFRLLPNPSCADSLARLAAAHVENEIALVVGGEVIDARPAATWPAEEALLIRCSLKKRCQRLGERLLEAL